MEKQTISKFSGQIVGYYEVQSNGDKTIKDFFGRILGYYYKGRDVTTNFHGVVIAHGDISGIFFKDQFNI
ncbi:MAG: hypothetical protein J5755_02120 [Clostridia bacterium]|nr:hypothetical protein [Clostridia bacterium]